MTHGGDGAHAAHAVRDLDGADFALDQVAVDVDVARPAVGVEAEGDGDAVEQPDHRLLVDHTRADGPVLKRIERHGTVHGARVDEDVAQTAGNGLGEGALAARREAVDGDYDFLFSVRHWGICQKRWIESCRCPADR